MTSKQRHARNEAHQLLRIAQRILDDAGLIAYAADVETVANGISQDARMMASEELRRQTSA